MSQQAAKRSVELFRSGFFCAESVLQAIAERCGIQSDLIPRIATGFCSGMARSGGMCGAVTGGIMGLNLVTGRDLPSDSLETNFRLVQELMDRFKRQYGTTNCRELLGCDLATHAGQRYFLEHQLLERCMEYAASATSLALDLLQEAESAGIK